MSDRRTDHWGALGGVAMFLVWMATLVAFGFVLGAEEESRKALKVGAAYHHPETGKIVYGCRD